MISGVYQIKNLINGKLYVGSAVNFKLRFNKHKSQLRLNNHDNIKLQNSFNNHSENNFVFEILATCPPEYCIKLEQWFIDNLKPEYNILKIAGSSLGYKHSNETKQRLKNKFISEETKNKISLSHKGKKLSLEHKEKISRKSKLYKHSLETRSKLSVWCKKPIIQYDLNDNFIKEWDCIITASKELSINRCCISNVCYNKQKRAGQFKWKFK